MSHHQKHRWAMVKYLPCGPANRKVMRLGNPLWPKLNSSVAAGRPGDYPVCFARGDGLRKVWS